MNLEFTNACEEAKKRLIKDGNMPYITEIVDIGDRWLFFGEIDDKDGADYGNNPVSVTKETGNVDDFYLGDIENYKLYENGADVEIPKEYQKNGTDFAIKQSIEKKLGCTIEEYAERFKERIRKEGYIEDDRQSDLVILSLDELDYMLEYSNAHNLGGKG